MKNPELAPFSLAMVLLFVALIIAVLARFHHQTQTPSALVPAARSATNTQAMLAYKARALARQQMFEFRPRPSPGDSDGDFWLDEAEVATGKNQSDPNSHPVFQFTITIPRFSVPGPYRISLTLVDAALNSAAFSPADLQARSLISSVTVT